MKKTGLGWLVAGVAGLATAVLTAAVLTPAPVRAQDSAPAAEQRECFLFFCAGPEARERNRPRENNRRNRPPPAPTDAYDLAGGLITDVTTKPNRYDFRTGDSYGFIRIDLDNYRALEQCPRTGVLGALFSLAVAERLNTGVDIKIRHVERNRILYAGTIYQVSQDTGREAKCQTNVNTGGFTTPIFALNGRQSIEVEFGFWKLSAREAVFADTVSAFSGLNLGLGELATAGAQNAANAVLSRFNNPTTKRLTRTVAFESQPTSYGMSFTLADGNGAAGVGAPTLRLALQTTRSIFGDWPGDPDFTTLNAANVVGAQIRPGSSETLGEIVQERLGTAWMTWAGAEKATDNGFTASCLTLANALGGLGLTNRDLSVTQWAAVSLHGAMATEPSFRTGCTASFFDSARLIGRPFPTLESERPAAPPAIVTGPASVAQMRRTAEGPFQALLRSDPNDDRSWLTSQAFKAGATMSQIPRPADNALIADNAVVGVASKAGCYAYTALRPGQDDMPGSRVEGLLEVGGTELYFRAFFDEAQANTPTALLNRLEVFRSAPQLAKDRIIDQHPEGCNRGAWKPKLVFGE